MTVYISDRETPSTTICRGFHETDGSPIKMFAILNGIESSDSFLLDDRRVSTYRFGS